MPNKLSQFWQEIKRRRVHRLMAIYAGSAYVIFEASTLIFPRWGLPDWTIDLVLYLLILGTIVTFVLGWIFDLTPEGIQKTKPGSELQEGEVLTISNGWKIATYVSVLVIIGLLVINIVGNNRKIHDGDIQSLVILPFDNFTGDDNLEYFVSGMHASLIGDVGQLDGLKVKSRTSSNAFKGMDMTIPEIASELGADAALETAVMCLGDTICVQFRLLSTAGDEEQLWAAEYKEGKSQILTLYNRITKQIAKEVMIELTADQKRRLDRIKTVNIEAYDAFLKSGEYLGDLSKESLDKAHDYLTLAIEKDPEWAPLYAGMAMVWVGRNQMGLVLPDTAIQKIHNYLQKALELDPDLADSHSYSGVVSVWTDWNWDKGEKDFQKALSINPNDAMSRMYYAHLLMILQRPDESITHGQIAVDLDTYNTLILGLYADVLKGAGDLEGAYDYCEKALAIEPENRFALGLLKGTLYLKGDYDSAFEIEKNQIPLRQHIITYLDSLFKHEGRVAAYKEMAYQLELLSHEKYVTPMMLARIYNHSNQLDKAVDMLEKAYELHEPSMPYIAAGLGFEKSLHDHPRYIDLLKKMNLPQPEDLEQIFETTFFYLLPTLRFHRRTRIPADEV